MTHSPSSDEALGVLSAGCANLGLDLSVDQKRALLVYGERLLKWNSIYNLTALRSPDEVLSHHILDCLAVLPVLPMQRPIGVLDVGSGGGLPGVVWAIACPKWQVTCVDAVGKKVAFITQIAAELRLSNLGAVHTRLDAKRAAKGLEGCAFDLVVSRAFASLADFTALTMFHVKPEPVEGLSGQWLALKGRNPVSETSALPASIQALEPQELKVPGLDEARCLVWLQYRANISLR